MPNRKRSNANNLTAPSTLPDWIEPMAATLTQERFSGPEWSFEKKFDGIRLIAYMNRRDIRLFSRNHLPQNIPAVADAIRQLGHQQLILDGEITWGRAKVTYHVFDIMWIDGRETMSLPLEERRTLLGQLQLTLPLRKVSELNNESAWERAQQEGWEGVIAKRRGSVYEPRRSRNWLKMKCELAQEFVVGGFTDPQGKRVGLGALLIGYYEADDFVFAGKIGTGFNTKLLTELRTKFDRIEITNAPFTKAVGLPRVRAHWVRPEIVVQVGFIQWTRHGKLRHPRLLGLRTDKDPRDVARE
jgi:ATP-dependent DNA ligase